MKWVTSARPKTDRIACRWLVRRFIDAAAASGYDALHAWCQRHTGHAAA